MEVILDDAIAGQDARLQSQRTEAFLSLARFSDAQYQSIDNYMRSSEFENKQALLEKAKEEVGLMNEHKVQPNRCVSHFFLSFSLLLSLFLKVFWLSYFWIFFLITYKNVHPSKVLLSGSYF